MTRKPDRSNPAAREAMTWEAFLAKKQEAKAGTAPVPGSGWEFECRRCAEKKPAPDTFAVFRHSTGEKIDLCQPCAGVLYNLATSSGKTPLDPAAFFNAIAEDEAKASWRGKVPADDEEPCPA